MDMANSNLYNRDDVIIDPRLNLPPDVIGVRTGIPEEMENEVEEEPTLQTADQDVFIDSDVFDAGEYDSGTPPVEVADEEDFKWFPPPSGMTIVSQTVRISPDGTHVVDVVFEVTGGLETGIYEARVSKVDN